MCNYTGTQTSIIYQLGGTPIGDIQYIKYSYECDICTQYSICIAMGGGVGQSTSQ